MKNEITQTLRPRRVLVVANETVAGAALGAAVRFRTADADDLDVVVTAPALNSRVRHWISDEDGARRQAGERLAGCLEQLRRAGVAATGWVGDADPLQAIADALHVFPADEIVIAAQPEDGSNWLARGLVARARSRYPQPILHVVVDERDPRAAAVAQTLGASLPCVHGPVGVHRRDPRPRAA